MEKSPSGSQGKAPELDFSQRPQYHTARPSSNPDRVSELAARATDNRLMVDQEKGGGLLLQAMPLPQIEYETHGFLTIDDATRFALDHIKSIGLSVTSKATRFNRETPKDFKRRHGISDTLFMHRVNHPLCPPFECERGITRILWLVSNPALEQWVQKRQ